MELLQLRYFLEVAESEHVTHSAQKLRVSQPSLTQAISRLERELGVQLFEPEGRGIRLTEAGRFYSKRIAQAVAEIDSATSELARFDEERSSIVRINVVSASNIVVDAVAEWRTQHPAAKFQIVSSETASKIEPCDIEVRMQTGKTSEAKGARLFKERIMLAVPTTNGDETEEPDAGFRDNPEKGERPGGEGRDIAASDALVNGRGEAISLAQMQNSGFIMLAGSRNISNLCLSQCAKLGFRPTIAFESDNPSVVRKMIGLGLGVGFWPEHSWGELGTGARLAPILEPGFVRTIEVARTRHGGTNEQADKFYSFLLQRFEARWNI
ncbi:LysR family transcriptional regulator [Slackia sp.]|uniref:LysR family transcriptional regulator n=1 Tax=Slackia sp. TaxID=2049041 RepID=UPI00257E54CD|nr:LysR family transcriptional regulator [Slackia sp.]MBS6498923.1 LysR family transcriptional regulator [Slackia sp.]